MVRLQRQGCTGWKLQLVQEVVVVVSKEKENAPEGATD